MRALLAVLVLRAPASFFVLVALLAVVSSFIPASQALAGQGLSVESIVCSYSVVSIGQQAVPLEVTVKNESNAGIFVQFIMPLFTNIALNDRAADYSMPGGTVPGVIIMPGVSHVFSLSVDVSTSALTDVAIQIDAAVSGYLLDTYEMVGDSSATAPHSWVVTSKYITAFVGLFDASLTPERSDDSLVALTGAENVPLNTVYCLNGGAPIADLPFETGGLYRLVFQFNPSFAWDYEPSLTEQGTCVLAGSLRGFGRAAAPNSGIKELLLADAFVADENTDPVDFVIGMTWRTDPPQAWSMVSDPWTDAVVMTNKTGEIGSLKASATGGDLIDCVDDKATWELAALCRTDQYYFYELWFQSDLEWDTGDTADVYLHIEGAQAPMNLEQLHVRFRLVDDDTIPPAFSDFSPEIVPAGESFDITCSVSDVSGVYDDDTGSSGHGVYLLWDDDGSLDDDANEIQMSEIGDGLYATDSPIGARTSGDIIVYSVHACDNDADGGKADDQSCDSSAVHTIQIVSTVYLVDVPGSRYPEAVYAGQEAVSIHIEVNNPMSQGITLYQTSTVSFSNGIDTVTANLRNQTLVPAGAVNFPISFDTVQVPLDFIAPDTVDLKLDLTGLYGIVWYGQEWAASRSNRLAVMKPCLFFTARPVPTGEVHPGDATIELMRIDVKNDSPGDVFIDSLVVSNATVGGGGVPMNDADFDVLRLYAQTSEFTWLTERSSDSLTAEVAGDQNVVESGDAPGLAQTPRRALGATDSLLAWARFERGEARLRFPGRKAISAGKTLYWFAVADVDSFLASDGDSIDVAIVSPDSVFISGAASVEFRRTPLNSEGRSSIDGFKAFQLLVEETLPDTLYLGDAGQPVLSVILPVNGHAPDVLSAVAVKNFGDSRVNDLIERLALWRDDGDGSFSLLNDQYIGDFAATGTQFELTGLFYTLLAPQRFFVVADFGLGTLAMLASRFGVPAGGIEYTSRNDGPIDRDVAADFGQVLLRREIVSIEGLPVYGGARHPGDADVELLALRVSNNTLGEIMVDSLRLRGDSSLFACESAKPFTLYADDGDSSFEPGVDTVVAEADWGGGAVFFAGTQLAMAQGSQRILYVTTALDSFLTVDGETILVGLESSNDIGFTLHPSASDGLFRLDADFPVVSYGGAVTDGMLAHQVTLYPHGDSVIVDQTEAVLVVDFLLSGNACLDDTLEGLTVTNLGTAGAQHIKRLVLWGDDGDGVFDAKADLQIAVLNLTTPKTYATEGLSEPLGGLPGSRFFISMDIPANVETGGTVRLAIPIMGISVASGDDGPIDREIVAPGIFTIPVPDRVTCFTSLLGNKRVKPGDRQVLNLVLGMYNSYQQAKTLTALTLLSVGSSRSTEILKVEAYADSDEDGLFNPSIDSLIGVAESNATGYSFGDLSMALKPYRSTLLFIAYETALVGIRDSIQIDFQVSNKSSIEFSGNPKVEGQFPLNSAGSDITDGMVSAQILMLAVPDARVSPGAVDIPCLSFVLPSNGNSEDVPDILRSISLQNGGTASQGQDIRYVKLWKDAGSMQFAFDSGDEFVAFLVWDGSSWRTFAPLAESIPFEGLALHVTVDIASTAQDGRSVDLCLPIDGALVSSGNDGPIDARMCAEAGIEITTDPLLASFTVPTAVTRDQIFEVRMTAANVGDTTLLSVMPDSFEYAGTGSCTLVSGPSPLSIDLAGGSDSSFAWTFSAQSTGKIVFRGRAKEEMGLESSRMELSDTIAIEEIPENVTVTSRDLAPVSLNRGQDDISLVEMVIAYDPASGRGAPVEFKSIDVLVANGAGASIPAEDVASRMRLRDESRVHCSVATDTISQPIVACVFSEPVIFHPGDSKTFRISVDVPSGAPASSFRLSIPSADKINLADHNSGVAVPFSGTAFPWSTNAVTLKDPATALLVRIIPMAPGRVNTGQKDVEAFDLILDNGGSASGAPVNVSEITFTVRDAGGDTIDAGKLFETFRLAGDGGNTYAYLEALAGSASIRCGVQPAINVASGVPVTLRGEIDCLSQPAASGFSIVLEDSLDVAARDVNSGQPVEVRPAGESPVFPMSSGTSIFCAPLESVDVEGQGLMEARIVAGTANAAALKLVLRHLGAPGQSSFSCAGITVRILDELGGPLVPIDVLAAVRVRKGIADIASVYINALHGSDIPLSFVSPLVASPGEADTLDVFFDLNAAPERSRFQMYVNEAGIDITDATDGRSGISLTGSFPVASGLGTIIFPAGDVLFDADGLLPPNMTAGAETDCMRLAFARGNESSGSRVFVDGFAFEVLDEEDQAVDPSLVIDALRIYDESGEIASTSQVVDGGIVVSFTDTIAIRENETHSFVLAITSAANPPVKAMSLRIVSTDAILCRDEASGGGISVVASPGEFPFGSGKTVILPRDVEAAFSNYPNPFIVGNEMTRITFYMPGEGMASVKVFTIPGELVRTIIENEPLAAGLHQEFSWDGKNGKGNAVLNGVYYLVLKVSASGREYTFKRKVALVQ